MWPSTSEGYLAHPLADDISQVLVGDISRNRALELYPVFDARRAVEFEAAVKYHNLSSFGRSLYSICSFHGSIPWMENANDISEIVRILNENMIAAAYIVHEPSGYWEQKRIAELNGIIKKLRNARTDLRLILRFEQPTVKAKPELPEYAITDYARVLFNI